MYVYGCVCVCVAVCVLVCGSAAHVTQPNESKEKPPFAYAWVPLCKPDGTVMDDRVRCLCVCVCIFVHCR